VSDLAHPLLPASTPLLSAGDGGLQVGGVDSTDGLLIGPDGGRVARLLRGLDGRRSQRAVLADAAADGHDPGAVRSLLAALRETGLVVDLLPADLLAADAGPAATRRTATEVAAAARAVPGGGAWRNRRAGCVVVDGATRVGVPLAAILAASGVGPVSVRAHPQAGAGDVVVGGLTAADEGRPRALAAGDAIRRASPLTDLRPPQAGGPADLVVLARAWSASDPLAAGLQRTGVPHLVATVRGETGVVGPLVVPGSTGCLRCADLHRRDADPRWPLLAAQLTRQEPVAAGATVTCLLTAATAAVQVLAWLDGAAPVVLDATLELPPADPLPRRRRWAPHPQCGCRSPGARATG
jgi:bacteriocin biosynthesis cyclodehydratase domain-containing protein